VGVVVVGVRRSAFVVGMRVTGEFVVGLVVTGANVVGEIVVGAYVTACRRVLSPRPAELSTTLRDLRVNVVGAIVVGAGVTGASVVGA